MVKATIVGGEIVTEATDAAREFYNQSRYGTITRKKVHLSFLEAVYLVEKKKLVVENARGVALDRDQIVRKSKEPNFSVRYAVYRNLRERGYIVKTALKFGADFRVYDRGVKPGEDHAKWVVFPVHESSKHTWQEFSAKNRVAHSTKKRLLLGIVDDEMDVTYYEVKWVRP